MFFFIRCNLACLKDAEVTVYTKGILAGFLKF